MCESQYNLIVDSHTILDDSEVPSTMNTEAVGGLEPGLSNTAHFRRSITLRLCVALKINFDQSD